MNRSMLVVCSLMTSLLIGSPPASAGKEEARDVGTGLSLLAGTAALAPTGVTQAVGIGGLVGQGIGFIGMGLWDFFAAAPANPDPNHAVAATVTPVVLTPVAGSGVVFANTNASLSLAGQLIDDSRLLDASLRRYFGAINDGNLANAALQRTLASAFLFELESDLLAYRFALTALSFSIQGDIFATLSTTVVDVLALRDQIVNTGFPAFEDFVFAQANATAAEIALAVQEVALADGTTISDSDLTGAVIFDRYSSALGSVDMRELLPAGFSPVPEPTPLVLLATGLVLLAAFRRCKARTG